MIFTACQSGSLDDGSNSDNGNGNGGGEVHDPNNPLSNQKCSNNELLYISKSCLPMELNTYDGWGAKLISNTYENGVGRLTFNGEVTTIPKSVFYENELLEFFKMPDSVTSIGKGAFSVCTSLTSVTIGNGVTSIGDYAFLGCKSLTRVDISDLSAWCKISFGDGSANPLCNGAKPYLNGNELTDITIPSDITEIRDYAFYYCKSLTSVTIGNSVTAIGEDAFFGCKSLTSVTIGNSVTSIGILAFYDCSSLTAFYGKFASADNRCLIVDGELNSFAPAGLTEYTIPNSVTSIGYHAFYDCSSLTSVTIPDSVISIGYEAFMGCNSMTSVYCKPTTPPRGASRMFNAHAVVRMIYVPAESVEAYRSAVDWKSYADYIKPYNF